MCSSKQYPYPPHGRSSEIPREGGGGEVLKTKILEVKYEAKLEFPGEEGEGGGGCKTKTFPWGKYGYFPELQNGNNDGSDDGFFNPC